MTYVTYSEKSKVTLTDQTIFNSIQSNLYIFMISTNCMKFEKIHIKNKTDNDKFYTVIILTFKFDYLQ